MEQKKTERADLENKRGIFFRIGILISMLIIFFAIEWKTYEDSDFEIYRPLNQHQIEELSPMVSQYIPPPPLPQVPQKAIVVLPSPKTDTDQSKLEIVDENHSDSNRSTIQTLSEEDAVNENDIFRIVENAPQFPGGEAARKRFLQENIRYPLPAKAKRIQGVVYITFVVERDGSVTDVKLLQGIGNGCDEEAVRVIRNMPRWEPGKQRGKPVRVQISLPIRFNLGG